MRKAFIFFQIVLVAGICAYIVYDTLKPIPAPLHEPSTWRSWRGFSVLSYTGVTKEGRKSYVSHSQLKEHLSALREAGYTTITPEDALSFLAGKSPLPDKALLLLFEEGRKDCYIYTTPLLQKFAMMAAMCVPTGVASNWGSFFLKEGDLKRIAKEANWRLCSMGNDAMREIPVDSAGTKGHFLTRRMWLGKKLEDDASFRARVTGDYAKAARLIESANGGPVTAYLYPFSDAGTGASADRLAAEINRQAVASYHRLAFTAADHPFNGPLSNPYNLSRLRVSNSWSGSRLVQELDKFMPRESPVTDLQDDTIWLQKGAVRRSGNMLALSPGSSLWLRGSDGWSDLDVSAVFHLAPRASAALHVRYDGLSYARLTLTQNNIHFYEHTGQISQALAWSPVRPAGNGTHKVRLRVKGNRAWVWHNDRLIAGAVPLSTAVVRGRMGVSCQDAELQLQEFHVSRIPKVLVLSDSFRTLPPSTQQEIVAIVPAWFSSARPPLLSEQQRADLLHAASAGVRTIPIIETERELSPEAAEKFAAALVSALDRASVKPLLLRFAVYGLETNLSSALHNHGFRVIRILSPQQTLLFVQQKMQLNGDSLLIDGPEKETQDTLANLLHSVPPDRLIVRTDSKADVPPSVGIALSLQKKTEKGTL